MTLPEFFAELESRSERDPKNDYAGKLTQGDLDSLDEWMEQRKAKDAQR